MDNISRRILRINSAQDFNDDDLVDITIERADDLKTLAILGNGNTMLSITHDGNTFQIYLYKGDWVVSGDI